MASWASSLPSGIAVFIRLAPSTPMKRLIVSAYSEEGGWGANASYAASHGPAVAMTQSCRSRKRNRSLTFGDTNLSQSQISIHGAVLVVPQAVVLQFGPPPHKVLCQRRPNLKEGVSPGLARDLCRPAQEPCVSCGNLATCQIKN